MASSIGAFVLLVWALSRWTVSATAYVRVLSPLVTVLLAVSLGGETVTLAFLGGGALVVAGVYLGVLSRPRAPALEKEYAPTTSYRPVGLTTRRRCTGKITFVPRVLLALLLVAVACTTPAAEPTPSPAAPEAAATPAPSPSPVARRAGPPASAGAAADAGVLYVFGPDDGVYRYDGASGTLERIWRASSLIRESGDGAYVAGHHGGVTLLRWDGLTLPIECGKGLAVSVAANAACASAGGEARDHALWVRLPGEARARLVLPADWGALAIAWSPDASRLAIVRLVRARPGPGMDPGEAALWILESDGNLRELYHARPQGILSEPTWSPDGTSLLVWRNDSTSNSLAADKAGIALLLIDVATGRAVDLGGPRGIFGQARWAPDGRLAFVRGGGRMTWENKDVVVRERHGPERVAKAPTDEARVGLAPAWSADGRLAWVSGPVSREGNGGGYVDGTGGGARSIVIDDGALPFEVRCGESRVAEGVRWAADGRALLLLCRKVGRDAYPLEVWLHRSDGTQAPLVTGLVGSPAEAGGFGFYGAQPSLFRVAAWSRAVR